MARVIAVANQKGGVGKTTTTVNLTAALQILGQKVLLVDCDPQGSASSGYGIAKDDLEGTVYDLLVGKAEAEHLISKTKYGVDVLPANMDLVSAESELVSVMGREKRLKKALKPIQEHYDYIFIDCPPSLGLITLNALKAADSVLIPIQCEFFALEGVTQLLRTLDLVREDLNPDLSIEGVLMTMYDSRTKLANQVVESVRENFGEAAYNTLIPRLVRIAEAPSYGLPVIHYDEQGRGAGIFIDLAKEVLSRGKDWHWWRIG